MIELGFELGNKLGIKPGIKLVDLLKEILSKEMNKQLIANAVNDSLCDKDDRAKDDAEVYGEILCIGYIAGSGDIAERFQAIEIQRDMWQAGVFSILCIGFRILCIGSCTGQSQFFVSGIEFSEKC